MFTAIGQGILFGIALCFSIGPSFFGLIQTSLKHGYGSGIAMALGIFASDLIYLLLAYFGVSGWVSDPKYSIPVGLVGGILLISYGVLQIVKKTVVQGENGEPIEFRRPTRGASVLKGFLMNMFNPVVVLLWVAAIGLASSKLNNDNTLIIIYFVATLATVLGTDILKSLAAAKIKNYLNEKVIHKVNTLAGIILIISGIVMIVRIFVEPAVKVA